MKRVVVSKGIDMGLGSKSSEDMTLSRSGVLAERREGTQMYYRLQSERVATLCRAVCTQVAIELDPRSELKSTERLVPVGMR